MWGILIYMYFIFGYNVADSNLCQNEEGIKVMQICTAATVTSNIVAISTDGLSDSSTVNCSCTATVFNVVEDLVPVLYFYGPGYPNCGIEIDVGGYIFSCFQGFLNLPNEVYDIKFKKMTTNGNPEACLLFITGNPNTEVRIACEKSTNLYTTPRFTTSKTTPVSSRLTTGPAIRPSTYTTRNTSALTGSTDTNNVSTSFGISSTKGNTPPSTTHSPTSVSMDTPINATITGLSSDTASTATSSSSSSDSISSIAPTMLLPQSTTVELLTSIGSKSTVMPNSSKTNLIPVSPTTLSFVPSTTESRVTTTKQRVTTTNQRVTTIRSNVTTTKQRVTTKKLHVTSTASQEMTTGPQITTTGSKSTLVNTTGSISTTAEPKVTLTESQVPITGSQMNTTSSHTDTTTSQSSTSPTHIPTKLPPSTIGAVKTHTSSPKTTQTGLPSTTATNIPHGHSEPTTGVGISTSTEEKADSYVIVIAVCSVGFVILLTITALVLFIVRYRRRQHRTVIKPTNDPPIPTAYIDAFEDGEGIFFDESVFFTETPVTPRPKPSRAPYNHVTKSAHPRVNQPLDELVAYVPSPTKTDIYAVVTKQPESLVMQPRPKLISFKGIENPVEEGWREKIEIRKPMTQYGVLKKRESLRLVRSLSENIRPKKVPDGLARVSSHRHVRVYSKESIF